MDSTEMPMPSSAVEDDAGGSLWRTPSQSLGLAQDDVHVWSAWLNLPAAQLAGLWSLLTPDEQSRATQFKFARHRNRFIATRGILRSLTSQYVGIAPGDIRFNIGPFGKPEVAHDQVARLEETPILHFNLAHSNALVLLAFTRGRRIGVDVEQTRSDVDPALIAGRVFSQMEQVRLHALPAMDREAAFFVCWTRKEAYVKARGTGLSLPLEHFSVTVGPNEPARLLSVDGDPQEAARWTLKTLDPGLGYVAALAVEGSGWRLSRWQWSPNQAGIIEHER